MNKTQLVDAIAQKAGITKVDAKKALDAFMEVTKETVKKDKVVLIGFGTFSVAERSAREGKNPRTGAKIKIPAKKVVKFKAGSELESAVK
ncbi:MAG: HU family DNA-binding protein [Bacteroidales bacterium]|nr:HU family DNA-binding protein [Bacteroidales bacterium]